MAEAAHQTTGWVAFHHRDFRFVFVNRILSAMATAMLQVALGWEMWRVTQDPFVSVSSGSACSCRTSFSFCRRG